MISAQRFYGELLGCREGRSAETWADFDFFGHHLSLHRGEPALEFKAFKDSEAGF